MEERRKDEDGEEDKRSGRDKETRAKVRAKTGHGAMVIKITAGGKA
jgi:hypothetical protein